MRLRHLAVLFLFSSAPLSAAENLDSFLEKFRAQQNFPGLAALVLKNGAVHAEGAAGVRKYGSPERLTVRDKFHIGSNTKAMTATLAAMLVEQRRLSWSDTPLQKFPDLHAAWGTVTLQMLLSHRSGAPANANVPQTGTVGEQRVAYLRQVAARAPEHPPGSRFLYSNAGYVMAGAMLERATGKAWEDLMREMLFTPLNMKSCGFGPPPQQGGVNNPWGHQRSGSDFVAYDLDNPPYLGPAGTVHCSLQDYARFALLHMRKDRLLGKPSFAKLQSPPAGETYALGWIVVQRGWAGGAALNHNGSNTVNYFVAWLAPARGFGVIIATNLGGDVVEVGKQVDAVASALVQSFN
jgi:CubicO group peptidase (beta-lactamase class C family)